ncbi:MAG: hypothetical protein NTZ33_10125 [Bacteroidetes bacterium]|nr:hypothetical protein [Bacteroidota bacterium]
MKKVFLIFGFLFLTSGIFAQGNVNKGQTQINAGIGFSNWGLPIYVGFDYGVHPDISLGAELSYRSFSEDFYSIKYSHTVIGILGNANYHFNRILNIPSSWDFYAGLNIGFVSYSSSSGYGGSGSSGLGIGAQIGGRYYFSKKFGLNIEFGGGNRFSQGKYGITYKL